MFNVVLMFLSFIHELIQWVHFLNTYLLVMFYRNIFYKKTNNIIIFVSNISLTTSWSNSFRWKSIDLLNENKVTLTFQIKG